MYLIIIIIITIITIDNFYGAVTRTQPIQGRRIHSVHLTNASEEIVLSTSWGLITQYHITTTKLTIIPFCHAGHIFYFHFGSRPTSTTCDMYITMRINRNSEL